VKNNLEDEEVAHIIKVISRKTEIELDI